MPAHRGTWLKKCAECGKKYKPRDFEPGEFRKLRYAEDGRPVPLCDLIRCRGTQEEKDNFTVIKIEKSLIGSARPDRTWTDEAEEMLKAKY